MFKELELVLYAQVCDFAVENEQVLTPKWKASRRHRMWPFCLSALFAIAGPSPWRIHGDHLFSECRAYLDASQV